MVVETQQHPKDAGELQNVLTRYVDSFEGYLKAAQLVENRTYAAAFVEIAERREHIVHAVAQLIEKQGEKSDKDGSTEATLHRWWMTIRAAMTEEELRVLLEECIRGEKELSRTVNDALHNGELERQNYQLLAAVGAEVDMAIETFVLALKN